MLPTTPRTKRTAKIQERYLSLLYLLDGNGRPALSASLLSLLIILLLLPPPIYHRLGKHMRGAYKRSSVLSRADLTKVGRLQQLIGYCNRFQSAQKEKKKRKE